VPADGALDTTGLDIDPGRPGADLTTVDKERVAAPRRPRSKPTTRSSANGSRPFLLDQLKDLEKRLAD